MLQRDGDSAAPHGDVVGGEGQEAAHLQGEHHGLAGPWGHSGALVVHGRNEPDHLALHDGSAVIVVFVQACGIMISF